jgi:hypothetical protein
VCEVPWVSWKQWGSELQVVVAQEGAGGTDIPLAFLTLRVSVGCISQTVIEG